MAAVRAAIETAQRGETALGARADRRRGSSSPASPSARRRSAASSRASTRWKRTSPARIEQARQRQAQLGRAPARGSSSERERTDAAAREVAVERDRREDEARQAGESTSGRGWTKLRALEEESRAVQGELNRLVAGIHEIELKATEGGVRREELAQEAYRTYGVEADGAAGAARSRARPRWRRASA